MQDIPLIELLRPSGTLNLPDPFDPLQLDPGAEWRYRRQLCAEAYDRGHATGWHEGYEQACRDMEARWQVIAQAAISGAPSDAELELRRWGPGGREHFADPRPTDYQGFRRWVA